jgi:hypothetical protein
LGGAVKGIDGFDCAKTGETGLRKRTSTLSRIVCLLEKQQPGAPLILGTILRSIRFIRRKILLWFVCMLNPHGHHPLRREGRPAEVGRRLSNSAKNPCETVEL